MRAATALAHLAAMPKIEPDQPLDLAALVPPSAILYSLTQVNCCKQAIALKTPLPSDNSCIAQAVCAVVPILRHGRPSSWANRESSRIIVADCFVCRIWIIVREPCSTASRRVYEYAIDQFIALYCSQPRLAFNRIVVARYRMHLESRGLAANTINQQLAAVRRLAHEAADSGLLSPELAAGISRVKGVKQLGFRSGNWLSVEQSSEVLKHAYGDTMRAKRNYAMLAMLFGCGFRRSELVGLEMDEVQMRQGNWAWVDLIGKGGHIRTVPIPEWVKAALDQWTAAAGVREGRIFRA